MTFVLGQLDRRITLQRNTPTRSAMGGEVDSWGTLAAVWAKRENLSGRELENAQAVSAEAQVRFTVRYSSTLSTLDTTDRISAGGETFDILSALPQPANRPQWIEILVKVRADA